jgi:ubiquinone/menaquinone biosynthesis C-methylase UbiE
MSNTKVKAHYQNANIAREYDRARFSSFTGRTFDVLEKRALRRVLSRVLSEIPDPRTLDVPCGTGRITLLLLEAGLNVTGGDISEAMLEVAREKCASVGTRATFRRLDLDSLDLPDQSFQLVTCIRLFHHLQTLERTAVLKELSRVSSRFVLINVSFSSPYYGLRRRIKRRLGQGVSRTSSTWAEILAEASAAGLRARCTRMVLPGVSEDMIVLLEKLQ